MTIKDTKGGADSNSYASTQNVDTYIATAYSFDASLWDELLSDRQEAALITATKTINRLKVKYPKVTDTQALKFPVTTNDTTLGDGFEQAQEAAILQALYLVQNSDAIQEAQANRIEGMTQQTMGKISQTMNGMNPMAMITPEALQILSPYIDLTVKAVR